mmetsp:Transcript_40490/g.87621  ORF Transcript_40490/g.87621 Transcript_40490/m.87621 type:complete len:360 (-) Transcript_40490:87-1166(-)
MAVPRVVVAKSSLERTSREFHAPIDTALNTHAASVASRVVRAYRKKIDEMAARNMDPVRSQRRPMMSTTMDDTTLPGKLAIATKKVDLYTFFSSMCLSLNSVGNQSNRPYQPKFRASQTIHRRPNCLRTLEAKSGATVDRMRSMGLWATSSYPLSACGTNRIRSGSRSSSRRLDFANERNIATASRSLPLMRRYLGLSGSTVTVRTKQMNPGAAHTPKYHAQCMSWIPSMIHAIEAAKMLPTIQKDATPSVTTIPLCWLGTSSAASGNTTGTDPPTPNPAPKRNTTSHHSSSPCAAQRVDRAHNNPKSALRAIASARVRLRPTRSAKTPSVRPPMSMPKNTAPLISAFWCSFSDSFGRT